MTQGLCRCMKRYDLSGVSMHVGPCFFCLKVKFSLQLRQSLITGGYELPNTFGNYDDTNEDFGDDGGFLDFEGSDGEMPENTYMNEDVNLNEKVEQPKIL